MELAREIIAAVFIGLGCFLALTGALGILRMPDFYTRVHPAGKTDTMAQTMILIGLLLYPHGFQYEDFTVPIKLVMITVLLYITAPSSTHAITQAAHLAGLTPWTKGDAATTDSLDGSESLGTEEGTDDESEREDWDRYSDSSESKGQP